jgi:hypothetical protein
MKQSEELWASKQPNPSEKRNDPNSETFPGKKENDPSE